MNIPSHPELSPEHWEQVTRKLNFAYDDVIWPVGIHMARRQTWGISIRHIHEGEAIIEAAGHGPLHAQAGQWIFTPKGLRLSQDWQPSTRLLSIHFQCEWNPTLPLINQPETLVLDQTEVPPSFAELSAALAETQKHDADEARDFPAFLQAKTAFDQWLSVWFRFMADRGYAVLSNHSLDPRILAVKAILDAEFFPAGLPFARLTQVSGLGKVQLVRRFKDQLHMTPSTYNAVRRLEFAKETLLKTDASIKELSIDCGFADPANFCAWFRRQTGDSPSSFRHKI